MATTYTPVRWLLLAVAVILFVLSFFGVGFGTFNPLPLGLAFFAGAFCIPGAWYTTP